MLLDRSWQWCSCRSEGRGMRLAFLVVRIKSLGVGEIGVVRGRLYLPFIRVVSIAYILCVVGMARCVWCVDR
jgi:hypothetical protein